MSKKKINGGSVILVMNRLPKTDSERKMVPHIITEMDSYDLENLPEGVLLSGTIKDNEKMEQAVYAAARDVVPYISIVFDRKRKRLEAAEA